MTSAGAQVTGLLTLPWFVATFATEEMLTFSERRGQWRVVLSLSPTPMSVCGPLFCSAAQEGIATSFPHLLQPPEGIVWPCRMVLGSGRFLTWWMNKRSRCERPGRGERLATGRDKPLSFILGGVGAPRKMPWGSILLSPAREPLMPRSTLMVVGRILVPLIPFPTHPSQKDEQRGPAYLPAPPRCWLQWWAAPRGSLQDSGREEGKAR